MKKINFITIFILIIIAAFGQFVQNSENKSINFFEIKELDKIKVNENKVGAYIYTEENFMGRDYKLIEGHYDSVDLENVGIDKNEIASIKVKNSYVVILFMKANFSGRKILVKKDMFTLPNDFKKNIQSVKVIKLESEYDSPIICYISNPIKEESNIYIKGYNLKSEGTYIAGTDTEGNNIEIKIKQLSDKYIIAENNLKPGRYYITVNTNHESSNEYELNIIANENKKPIIKYIKGPILENKKILIRGLNFEKDISRVKAISDIGEIEELDIIAINNRLIMVSNDLEEGVYNIIVENNEMKSSQVRIYIK